MCPLENIVVGDSFAVARAVCSLFSPLSPSLHRHLGALALQAQSLLRVMRSYIELALVIDVLDRIGVTIAKPHVSP